MPEERTRGDLIRAYLGGALANGGFQNDPLLSLGGYRSGSVVFSRGCLRKRAIRGVVVEEAAGTCAASTALLEAVDGTKLRLTPYGVSAGDAVAIAAGETKIVEGADGSWLRVRRMDAGSALAIAVLAGTEEVEISPVWNNGIAGPDVTAAQAVSGLVDYGFVMLRNESGAAIDSVALSALVNNGIRIAVEVPVDGEAQRIANRTTAPVGLTWVIPHSATLTVTNWEAGGQRALWIERTIAAGAEASHDKAVTIEVAMTVGTDTFHGRWDGRYRIEGSGLPRYETWAGTDTEPDVSGSPLATAATRGYALPALASGHTHRLRSGKRNAYGLLTLDEKSTEVRVGASGELVPNPPSAPQEVTLLGLSSGALRATGIYYRNADVGAEADGVALWVGVGADPNPASDLPVTIADMRTSFGSDLAIPGTLPPIEPLIVDAAGPYQDGTDVRGILRTLRRETAKSVTTLTRSGGTATATVANHGYSTGQWVRVSGAKRDEYNGYHKITVTGTNTFTFSVSGSPATPANGTIVSARCVFSENTTAVQGAVLTLGPVRVNGAAFLGESAALQQVVEPPADATYWVDEAKGVKIVTTTGSASLYVGTVLAWRAIYDSVETERNGLYLPSDWDLYNDDVSGAGTEGVEVGSWDPSSRVVYVTPCGSVRRMKIDATAKRLTYVQMDQVTGPQWSTHQGAVWSRWDGVHFQVYDAGLNTWVTYMSVAQDGTLGLALPINQWLTQAQIEVL